MMRSSKAVAGILAFILMLPLAAQAQDVTSQDPNATQTAPAQTYSQEQLSQMVAPIALYPDDLVGQIMMASTYPLEVVEASRWLDDPQNAQLKGDDLVNAANQQNWDPSIKSLVNFPQVLSMMNKNLQWTEQLGDAFLAQQTDVMDAVQQLRQRAQSAGHLASTPQQTVTYEDDAIEIQPTNPDVVYVPYYNPIVVYGPWPWPEFRPYYFPPPPGFYFGPGIFIGFGVGIGIFHPFWGWDHFDWYHHHMFVDENRFAYLNHGYDPHWQGGEWQHNPAHRHGVPYNSPAVQARFQHQADQDRRSYRGYSQTNPDNGHGTGLTHFHTTTTSAVGPGTRFNHTNPADRGAAQTKSGTIIATRPKPQTGNIGSRRMEPLNTIQHNIQHRQAWQSPAFESFSRGSEVRVQSQRGAVSRAAPVTRMASPSFSHASASHVSTPRGGGSSRGSGSHENGGDHNDGGRH